MAVFRGCGDLSAGSGFEGPWNESFHLNRLFKTLLKARLESPGGLSEPWNPRIESHDVFQSLWKGRCSSERSLKSA